MKLSRKKPSLFKNEKAISTVIATIILTFVTIVTTVAFAYYAKGTTSFYTKFEKIDVINSDVVKDVVLRQFNITIQITNTGTADTTIYTVYINGYDSGHYSATHNIPSDGLSITAGHGNEVQIYIPIDSMSSGTFVEIKIHTSSGVDRPETVILP